jgi:outer membrane protein OmpA-like peptidoglycan-associated protein
LALRAGYQFTNFGDLTGLTGLSLGAGVKYGDWQLDYALVTLGELGIANQIGLSLRLAENEKPTPSPTPSPAPSPVPAFVPLTASISQAWPPPVMTSVEAAPTPTPVPVQKMVAKHYPKPKRRPVVKHHPKPKKAGPINLRGPHSRDILSEFSMHFDTGSINLEEGDRVTALNMVMKKLEQYKSFKFIFIAGYADLQKIKPSAPYKSNLELSQMRAVALKKYLVDNGFDPNLIVTKGYGTNPSGLDPDLTTKHFNNRRIEVFIYSPYAR